MAVDVSNGRAGRKSGLRQNYRAAIRRMSRLVEFARCMFENRIIYEPCDKTQIGILIRGGVGDVMIAARWLHAVITSFKTGGDLVVDIYYALPENIVFIFGRFDRVRFIYNDITFEHVCKHYDLALVINHLGFLEAKHADAEKLFANPALSGMASSWLEGIKAFKRFTTEDYHPRIGEDFGRFIRENRFTRQTILCAQTGVDAPITPFPFLLPAGDELAVCEPLNRRYITVHDGWDAQLMMGNRRPTKSYPVGRWISLVCAIRQRFPDVAIVQLGGDTGAEIPGVDLSLKGAIRLAMAATVLAKSAIHIDTDSGLVHLAASLGTRAVVLFGPTDIAYFGYPDHANVHASGCNSCWLSSGSWITTCLIGDRIPRCMSSIPQQPILDAIAAALESDPAGS
jgi:hypothetical protein